MFEDAPFECLFAEKKLSSDDFVMDSMMPVPLELEDGGQAMVGDLIEVNPGTEDSFHPTFISACLSS